MKPVVDVSGVMVGVSVIASSIVLPLLERNLITRSQIRAIADGWMALDMPISAEQRKFVSEMVESFLSSIQADDPPDQGAPFKPKPDWLKNIIEGGKDGVG